MIRLGIGQTLLSQRKFADAQVALEYCLEIAPLDSLPAAALTTLAAIHFNSQTEDGTTTAVDYLKRALEADPKYAPALLLKANMWFDDEKLRKKVKRILLTS
jgi:Tfp pilus assembly protein PilF